MINYILIAVVAAIVGLAVWYIRKEKRRGIQCVGCPDAPSCVAGCGGCCAGCPGRCKSTQF